MIVYLTQYAGSWSDGRKKSCTIVINSGAVSNSYNYCPEHDQIMGVSEPQTWVILSYSNLK